MASPSPPTAPEAKHIVIVGGGIIGATSAYYLSRHASFDRARDSITLLEATAVAGGASGKAGGLLALWAFPACIVPLSYRLHRDLALAHGGARRWGYRAIGCAAVECRGRVGRRGAMGREDAGSVGGGGGVGGRERSREAAELLEKAGVPEDLDWVVPESVVAYQEMGTPENTAQVHPYLFTTSMAELAEEMGVRIVIGSATRVLQASNGSGRVEGVEYREDDGDGSIHTLPATHVVLSAGPWTPSVWKKVPISGSKAYSVTIRPSRPISAYAIFTQLELPRDFDAARGDIAKGRSKGHARLVTPEIYARPNNEVYACYGFGGDDDLPVSTALVSVEEQRCQDIVDFVGSISDELRDGEVTGRQACYLPNVSTGGGPIIGETNVKGLFIAAGHTCWGIQNAPGTGKLISEIIWEGSAKSANISSLSPKKFGL